MRNYTSLSKKIFAPKIQLKIENLFSRLENIYPERIIVYLKRDYPELSKRIRVLRDECGYIDNVEFFNDFGFLYVDVNKVDSFEEVEKLKILKVMERINKEKSSKIKNKNSEFDDLKSKLKPLRDYYINDNWYLKNDSLKQKIIEKNQSKFNGVLNRLLEFYPNRIIFNLYFLHRKFVEKSFNNVKNLLSIDNNKDFVELFGFIYIGTTQQELAKKEKNNDFIEVHEELVEFDSIYKNNNWQPISKKKLTKEIIEKVNYVFDITYAIYPNRQLNSLNVLSSFKYFSKYYAALKRYFGFDNGEELFKEFGFEYSTKLNINDAILPDFVYSPNKTILYKIFTNKYKIALDSNVCLIKEDAIKDLNIKILDLSRLANRTIVFESNAISNCINFSQIINPTSINTLSIDAINNCPNLDIIPIFNDFNSIFEDKRDIYEYVLLDENNIESVIVTNKLFQIGTHIMKISNKSLYLVIKGKYATFDNYKISEKGSNYIEIKQDMNLKLSIDYEYYLSGINDGNLSSDELQYVLIYERYYQNIKTILFAENSCSCLSTYNVVRIPQYENGLFVGYEDVDADEIFNDKIKHLVCSDTVNLTDKLELAIVGINKNEPFNKYKNFIYNKVYIKTFLELHNLDPSVFFNSSILANDLVFIKTIYKMYPHIDINLIDEKYIKVMLKGKR